MNTERIHQLTVKIERAVVTEQKALAALSALESLMEDEVFCEANDCADLGWELNMIRAMCFAVSNAKIKLWIELDEAIGIPKPQPSPDDIPF